MIRTPKMYRFRLVRVLICSFLLPMSVTTEEVSHHMKEDSTPVAPPSPGEHIHSDSSSTEQSNLASEHTSSQQHSTESAEETDGSVEESTEQHSSEKVSEDDGSRERDNIGDNPSISSIHPAQQDTEGGVEHESDVTDESERRESTGSVREVGGALGDQHITEGETIPEVSESESEDVRDERTREQYRKELLEQRERLLLQQQAQEQPHYNQQRHPQEQDLSGGDGGSARQELVEQREHLLRQQQMEQHQQQQQQQDDPEIQLHGNNDNKVEQREHLVLQERSEHWQGGGEDGESAVNHPSEVSGVGDHPINEHTDVNRESSGEVSGGKSEVSGDREGERNLQQSSAVDEGLPGEREETREREEERVGEGMCDSPEDDCPAEAKNDVYEKGMELVRRMNPKTKARGYELFKEAAESGHTKALEQLAYAHLVGSVLERNFTWSFEKFSELAEKGNPIGQQGLGFMYSTGIGVNSSQAKALIHYTFAALGGHHFAQMTMGYRSLMGIGVAQSCETALYYYQKAAKKVVDEVTILTGGLLISKVRLMEEDNEATNVYGVSEDDMIQYHNVFADSGNTGAQVLLGVYYMFGMAGAERNFEMALKFLEGAASDGFAAANALIGKIYTEGSAEVPRDYVSAMEYFKRARDLDHADGYSGMGMLYFHGMGIKQDYATALEYFQKAADKGSAEAQYYLGLMFYEGIGIKRNSNKALRYFQLASHQGHTLAIYRLGEMHTDGKVVKRNCNYAVELFKGVAERGKWTRVLEDAERNYETGDLDSALMVYLLLAEMGVEVAQTNAAYLLEQDGVSLVDKTETLKRALILWNRSASQGYMMARVKLGDYYYYGQGTEVNYEAAASQYRIASDKQSSAQAMFNLAYMYQQGYGLQKDYHLAKRYYDQAAEASGDAHVPVVLALVKLNTLYYCDSFLKVMSSPVVTQTVAEVGALAGENWDMYLITLLSGLLALVVMWRWR